MKIMTTQTVITNTIYVEDHLVEGLTEEELFDMIENDPAVFGIDSNPHVMPDLYIGMMDA